MSWILLTVIAQFISAIVAIIDKHIVSDETKYPKPFVYAFYTCLISGAWIVVYFIGFIPFASDGLHIPTFENVKSPTLEVVALSFLSAYTFFTALTSMFTALKDHDASDVIPVIGAVSALGSYGLGYFFLDTILAPNFTLGVVLLALGTFIVSRLRFPLTTALLTLYSGLFFALHYVSIKGLFMTTQSFDNGFFWSRIAFVFFALTLLMIPNYWERVRDQTKVMSWQARSIIIANKLLAGVSTILILKATDQGDVAVVQALGGLQFVFILLLGIFVSYEKGGHPVGNLHDRKITLQKAIFVAIISLGFLVLFI